MSEPGWPAYGERPPAYDPRVVPGALVPRGYLRVPVEHPSATTVLVLGILSLVVCPITGIFAITLGNRSLREIDADPTAWTSRQMVVIGRILGIVGVSVYGAIAVLYGVFLVLMLGFMGLADHF